MMLTKKIDLLDGQWVELKKPVYGEVLTMRSILNRREMGDKTLDDSDVFDFLAPFIVSWSYTEPVSRQALEEIDYQNVMAIFWAIVSLTRLSGELLKNFVVP